MKTDYIDRSVIKLRRKFGKDELVAELNRQISEKDIEIGKLKAEIDHLQAVQVYPQREIDRLARIENKKDKNYLDILKQNKVLRKRLITLQKDNMELICKLNKK